MLLNPKYALECETVINLKWSEASIQSNNKSVDEKNVIKRQIANNRYKNL